ncbi:MAG: hypothetical protein LBR60_02020 [Fibrobacter sp.]|jgi:hypothetical protein|nr:hypothetical protein [Fibrobacter sp.]
MIWKILFTAAIAVLLLRVFILHARARRPDSKTFLSLPEETKLAVLKESLLNDPSKTALDSLETFCREHGIPIEVNEYLPLMEEQIKISGDPNALALDDTLFVTQAEWLDSLTPLEWSEAERAANEGNTPLFITLALRSLFCFYSDSNIELVLSRLEGAGYPKTEELQKAFRDLVQKRDSSKAEETDLEILQKEKAKWVALIESHLQS